MLRHSKVYFSQAPRANRATGQRPDVSPALSFGEIEYILDDNLEAFHFPEKAKAVCDWKLADFDPDRDYICRAHSTDPIADFSMLLSLSRRFGEGTVIRLLQWTKDRGADGGHYYPINLEI